MVIILKLFTLTMIIGITAMVLLVVITYAATMITMLEGR